MNILTIYKLKYFLTFLKQNFFVKWSPALQKSLQKGWSRPAPNGLVIFLL